MDVIRYVVTDRSTAARAVVRYPTLEMEGDAGLCDRLRDYLVTPMSVVQGRTDQAGGGRATVLRSLPPGSVDWLEACLARAAEDLSLELDTHWT